ncbi:MAG: hypothetical protein LBE56_03115 [Tannerella sp.]|jgi:hypothetical protein|nr:hypothetical protein [Tannerella sp.]
MKQLNIFLILSVLNISLLFGQEASLRSTVGEFVKYTDNHPVEKIYLHLDKPYYAAGEYMYFRAYLADMQLDTNGVGSSIIYVELADSDRNIVRRATLYSDAGEFAGQILLPDSLPSAEYHLRAYTNMMRNAGEDYFFNRDIYVGNADFQQSATAPQAFDYQVSFFPEGGRLLEGLACKVAFKALGNDGFGTDISGVLIDSDGNEALRFGSLHLGMGAFTFTPEKGKTYKAVVESGGLQKEFALPAATIGYALTARQDERAVYLTIRTNSESPGSIYLIGQSRNTVSYALEGVMTEKQIQYNANKNDLSTGILQFTLFKDGLPVSERLMFVDFKDDLQVNIAPDKTRYEGREEAIVQIQVTDKSGRPVEGSFSLAVTDDKTVRPSVDEQNIKGSMLLDADLKGYIESPGWYFAGNEPERAEALDNLLCTQGWSRFEWDKLADQPTGAAYPLETGFPISGKLINQSNGRPIGNALVNLTGAGNQPESAITDENGRFVFTVADCPETASFVLQCLTKQDRKTVVNFEMDKPDFIPPPVNIIPHNQANRKRDLSLMAAYLKQSGGQVNSPEEARIVQLPEVTAEARKIPNRESFGTGSQRFGGKSLERSITIVNVLRTLPSPRQKGVPSINTAGFSNVPVIYDVDGTRMYQDGFEATYGSLQARMFETVEVICPEDALPIYGREAMNGAYVFKTKKFTGREEDVSQFVTNGYVFRPGGYTVRKEFYMPAYENPQVKQSTLPDLRTTIYWNPVIYTDRAGKAEVRFFTADDATASYSFVLEGIGDGKVTTAKQP